MPLAGWEEQEGSLPVPQDTFRPCSRSPDSCKHACIQPSAGASLGPGKSLQALVRCPLPPEFLEAALVIGSAEVG